MKRFRLSLFLMISMFMTLAFLAGCGSQENAPTSSQPTAEEGASESDNQSTEKKESDWPKKPITLVVPSAPGGGSDIMGRSIAEYFEAELGQQVVVQNVAGAGGTIGSRQVKDAKPDGYTMLFGTNNIIMNEVIGLADFGINDFEVIGTVTADNTYGFFVGKDSPFKSVTEVVEQLKKEPKSLSIAVEIGGHSHMMITAFQEAAGVEFNVVDLGPDAQKVAALMGGQIDIMPSQYANNRGYLESGDIKYIGIMTEERSEHLPEVPTFKEQGIDFTFPGQMGALYYPKGTDQEIVVKVNEALLNILNNNAEYKAQMDKYASRIYALTPDEALKYLQENKDIFMMFKSKVEAK
ncbi:tripartite tricarboxylate transporter substrate binding protein [Bacillus sp. Marseille-P3661]|uniref:tripartite tricarboxylate transporter substrate binding protein n=1 Tax=Bacillus sp. Marseille-P3661 TaxID=1936234 RepID=UPI000C818DD9|nr:tripartite tricarboxylate transporter substrate binding protein [Bacillus sp. Marseille-P3661]